MSKAATKDRPANGADVDDRERPDEPLTVDAIDQDETDEQREARERADLNAATVTLEWRGQVFLIPKRRGRWPTAAAREFGCGRTMEGLAGLIGAAQWPRLEKVCPFMDDIDEFSEYAAGRINTECVP